MITKTARLIRAEKAFTQAEDADKFAMHETLRDAGIAAILLSRAMNELQRAKEEAEELSYKQHDKQEIAEYRQTIISLISAVEGLATGAIDSRPALLCLPVAHWTLDKYAKKETTEAQGELL